MKSKFVIMVMLLAGLALGSTGQVAAQPQSLTVTVPASDTSFDAAEEYNSFVWNHPLDMADPLDVQQLDSAHAVYPNHFDTSIPCDPGLWCGKSIVDDPDVFLLNPGYAGAMHVGRDGNLRPIDAAKYTRLTFRMWLDSVPPNSVGWQVLWTNGTVADFCDAQCGQSVFFPLYPGWNIYSADFQSHSTTLSGMDWTGNLTGLRLDIGNAGMAGHVVKLDWARLSGPDGENQTVQWNASGESGRAAINLISSDGTSTPYHSYVVFPNQTWGSVEPIDVTAGAYTFRGSLPPDDWRVNVQALSSGQSATSPGRWRIQAAPTLSFVKPSYTTGDDYASVVQGDPWNMDDLADFPGGVINAGGVSWANGVLSAQSYTTDNTTCVPGNCNPHWADPQVLFLDNQSPVIDTHRFRYVTFNVKVDGAPDVSYGYIVRLYWPYYPCGYSNDIPLHADWNVVSVDLWDNNSAEDQPAPGCTSHWLDAGTRNQFRLDPHEIPIATTFHLQSLLLTAMDTASTTTDFPIEYLLGKPGESVTFYYNTTRTIYGRQRVNGSGQIALPQGAFQIFLPFIFNGSTGSGGPPGTQTLMWHLGNVNPGTYYLSADVSDNTKTTTWFSDTPVVVTP